LCYSEDTMTKNILSTRLAAITVVIITIAGLILTTSVFSSTHQVFGQDTSGQITKGNIVKGDVKAANITSGQCQE
jgi:hypothetical protein